MQETGQPFEVALAVTRAGNLFTTHTAVAAGFDRFTPASLNNTSVECRAEARYKTPRFAGPGPPQPNDSAQSFNMALLAIRAAGR